MTDLTLKFKILTLASGFYLVLALILQIDVIQLIWFPDYSLAITSIFSHIDESIYGFFFIGFLAIFISTILFSNKKTKLLGDEYEKEAEKKKSRISITLLRAFITINLVVSIFWFIRIDAKVEGDPGYDGKEYYVSYRGDFVKNISKEQYHHFTKEKGQTTAFIFSSFFLMFTGGIFSSIAENYTDLKEFKEESNNPF